MTEIIAWPRQLLAPAACRANLNPFSRSGGRSLGGLEPTVRTDLGFWSITLDEVPVHSRAQRQAWNAIRQQLSGRAGLVSVPVWSFDTAPYVSGQREQPSIVPHSDGTPFSDGTMYEQDAISVVSVGITPIGATVMKLRIINAATDLVGMRFSYNHALYETGPVIDIEGDVWTVPISPSVRAEIPDGADLNFDMPTCLCHLEEDRGMDALINSDGIDFRTVSFSEANEYWNRLALGLEI